MPDILYEDNHVLVAVKPPNMLSQADATGDTDMLTELKNYIREAYHKPGNVYLGLVHRLDRPVGGLMVLARTSKAASRLSAQMAEHEMGREYLCVVTGEVEDQFTLTDYLVKDPIKNRVVVCEADARGSKLAILHGRCIARREGTALCAIRLETGRSHQIRVQMANIGAPLWGDNRYGKGIPGQQIALWGYKLTFEHPVTHEKMTFHAMPEGGIWSLYADLLTVPEDTKEPETPRDIHLSEEVAETIERYERPLKREAPKETSEAQEPPKRRLRPGMKGYTEQRREEMMRMPGISLREAEKARQEENARRVPEMDGAGTEGQEKSSAAPGEEM